MELFRLLGTVAVDATQAKNEIDSVSEKADASGNKTSSAFEKIGGAAVKIGKTVLAAGTAIGGAWIAAIEGSREYRTEMGKLDTAFVTNGHSSESATKTYQALQSVLGETDVSVEAANHLAVMTDNEKDLQTWTDICTGVFATFGDSLPIEGLTEAANETAKVGQVTGPLADALNWAGISEDEFNDKLASCTTEQERQKLIMETLNGTYKQASSQYKETNKDVIAANKAQEKLNGAMAELGRIGEPVMTAVKNKIAEMVTAAVPHLENLVKKVKDIGKWIKTNKNEINAWAAVIIGATVSVGAFVLALKWSAIMSSATKAIKGVRAAVILFNAALRANPIGLVISLIAGLVAAFIYLWNNNKGFRDFWISMWSKIKSATSTAVSWIKGRFSALKDALQTVKKTFGDIKSAISERLESAKEAVKKAVDKIKGFFKFKWSLPKLKVPSFSIKGKFDMKSLSVPKIGINWNAEGAIFSKPTILDTRLGLQGVGDGTSAEAVAPIDVLQGYIASAVRSENGTIGRIIIEQNRLLMDYLERAMPKGITLDSGALVGELTPEIDRRMNDRWEHAKRWNTR